MADERGDKELPQRFRGEAWAATSPSGSSAAPAMSAELRQRLEAAVTDWHGTAGQSPAAAPPPGVAAEAGTAAEAGSAIEPGAAPEAEPESVSWLGAGLAALIVIPALVIGSLAVVAVRHFSGTHA